MSIHQKSPEKPLPGKPPDATSYTETDKGVLSRQEFCKDATSITTNNSGRMNKRRRPSKGSPGSEGKQAKNKRATDVSEETEKRVVSEGEVEELEDDGERLGLESEGESGEELEETFRSADGNDVNTASRAKEGKEKHCIEAEEALMRGVGANIAGETGIEGGDQRWLEKEANRGKKGNDIGFTRVLTARERESARKIQAAEKAAAASLRAIGAPRMGGRNPGEFSTVFERTGEEASEFPQESFVSVYMAIGKLIPNAFPRITKKGGKLEVWVHTKEENEKVKKWTKLGGVGVRACLNGEMSMWGRIENVHYQFSEETIMGFLRQQGVSRVRRVQYTRHLAGAESLQAIKVNTDKVDIQFEGEIKKQVTIAGETFDVTLAAPPPIQCTKCLKFNHKKDECTAQELTCATCGQLGHMTTSCKNAPNCVNCKLKHHALSTRCPVYQAWANAARRKYENKVMESTNGEIVERMVAQPAHRPTTRQAASATGIEAGISFADKVVARALVVQKEDGSQEVICNVQEIKSNAQKSLQHRTKSRQEQANSEVVKESDTERAAYEPGRGQMNKIENKEKVKQEQNGKTDDERKKQEKLGILWEKCMTFLRSLTVKYPEIGLLIIILEEAAELILPQKL